MTRNHYGMFALAIAAGAVALWAGVSPIFLVFLLVCPLMMFFMMRGMHGGQNNHGGHGSHDEAPRASSDGHQAPGSSQHSDRSHERIEQP